jgi:DNA-binding response OmpR family regulator
MEVLRFLKSKQATKNIPVLVLTNSSRAEDIMEAGGLGAAGYLVKAELSLAELGSRIKQLVDKQGAHAESVKAKAAFI